MSDTPLIQIQDLSTQFRKGKQTLKAVDGVTLNIHSGETLGLVGESGCGKSTLGRTLMGLYPPETGQILYRGTDLALLKPRERQTWRQRMQMVFQDPYASLNPRMTVEDLVGEPLDIHGLAKGKRRRERVGELLSLVGLLPSHLGRYPHEFSGGQRQRIGIARALAVEPEFLVCDEAISALDVSVQAQVVELLKRLQSQMSLTYLFIAHDLSMVEYLSDRVAVMYLGQLMELAPSRALYQGPLHPYTQALLSAIPLPDPRRERNRARIVLKGEVPSPIHPPSGCVFRTRCPLAQERCAKERPQWREALPGHFVSCHFAGQ